MKFLILISALLTVIMDAAPETTHTCRILFLDGPDSAPDKLHLFDGAKSIEVDLPRMNLSKVYELRPGLLELKLLPSPVTDPKKIPAGAPSVKVPAEMADFYLLLTSDPANPVAPVKMQAINADATKLRTGEMLWFNLTGLTVGGKVGDEILNIKPMTSEKLEAPAGGNEDYPVDLAFRIPGKEHIYPLCETKWRHDPRSRSLAFIIAKAGSRTPLILVFPDFRPQKQAE